MDMVFHLQIHHLMNHHHQKHFHQIYHQILKHNNVSIMYNFNLEILFFSSYTMWKRMLHHWFGDGWLIGRNCGLKYGGKWLQMSDLGEDGGIPKYFRIDYSVKNLSPFVRLCWTFVLIGLTHFKSFSNNPSHDRSLCRMLA